MAAIEPRKAERPHQAAWSSYVAPVFAVVVVLAACAQIWHSYGNAVADVVDRVTADATTAESYAGEVFGAAELALRSVDKRPATSAIVVSADPVELNELLSRIRRSSRALDSIGYVNASGRIVASSTGSTVPPTDLSDRPYFQYLRDNLDYRLQISRPVVSRPRGNVVIPVAMRTETEAGAFSGMVAGLIDPAHFSRFFANATTSIIAIVDDEGFVMARNPPDDLVGRKARFLPPLHGKAPYYLVKSPDTGESRVVVTSPIAWSDLHVVASAPFSDVVDAWLTRANGTALIAGLAIMLTFFLAELAKRRAREAAAQLADSTKSVAHFRSVARNKSDFLAHMGHEIRTPINAIVGFSEVIATDAMKLGAPQRYREYAADIRFSAEHLLAIINSILDMSKIEAGKWKLALAPVDSAHVLSTVRHLAEQRATKEKVVLEIDAGSENVPFTADERVIVQIVLNLAINAIKFAGADRRVRMGSRALPDARLEFWVADRGRGMTPEQARCALEPFETAGDGDQRSDTGLGLPLSQMLARLHDGSIEIDSAPGQGTRVRLLLPVSGPQQAAA